MCKCREGRAEPLACLLVPRDVAELCPTIPGPVLYGSESVLMSIESHLQWELMLQPHWRLLHPICLKSLQKPLKPLKPSLDAPSRRAARGSC